MATTVAAAAGAPGAPAEPTRQEHESGAGALLALAGLAAAGIAGWWLVSHRKASPTPTPASGNRFVAGSVNPSLLTPAGWGLPGPGEIPCYGQVAPYANQGVTTTIGQGPAGFIPWGQPLVQVGADVHAQWPLHPNVPGTATWVPTDYKGCLASAADITPV